MPPLSPLSPLSLLSPLSPWGPCLPPPRWLGRSEPGATQPMVSLLDVVDPSPPPRNDPALHCSCDGRGLLQSVSSALLRLSGWRLGQVQGTPLVLFSHPDDQRTAEDLLQPATEASWSSAAFPRRLRWRGPQG